MTSMDWEDKVVITGCALAMVCWLLIGLWP